MSAKTLVMLGLTDSAVNQRVQTNVLTPLMNNILAALPRFPIMRNNELLLLAVFARGDVHKVCDKFVS